MASKFEKRRRGRLAETSPLVKGIKEGRNAPEFPGLQQFERECLTDYHPHAKQRELHENIDARVLAVVAGRRSGKTTGCGREFCRRVSRDYEEKRATGATWRRPSKLGKHVTPFLEYWCIAPTHRLTGFQQREVFATLGGSDSDLVLKWNASRNVLWLVGGIKVSFLSADNPDLLVASGLDGVWMDEAARCKSTVWEENVYATLSDKGGWAMFSSTPLGKNWLYKQIWSHTQLGRGDQFDGYFGVHFTTMDNTAVPRLVAEAERAERELPRPVYLRNYAASFDAFRGKVYEDFLDDSTHIVTRVPFGKIVRRIAGVDWGYNNPGVQLEAGIDTDDQLWIYREDYRSKLNITPPPGAPNGRCWTNLFKAAKERRGVSRWWADPSEPEHIDTCKRHGIGGMRGAPNDVMPGIEAVATLLKPVKRAGEPGRGSPALYIHRGCSNLREELSSYRFREDSEKPVKENDHACDALRYLVFGEHKRGGSGIARLDFSIFDEEQAA